MKKISTGQDSTLENWIYLCIAIMGAESPATLFLKERAAESPNGMKEEVIADETQLILALVDMNLNGKWCSTLVKEEKITRE